MNENKTKRGNNMSEFGDYLKEKRIEKDVSLRKMSKDLDISVSYLSDIESGHKMVPNSKDEKYKNLLNSIVIYLGLNNEEKEKIINLADRDLIEKGHMSTDITDYIGENPLAGIALRKAKESNLTDDDWKEFIAHFSKK